ncbi:MAG: hypothetical protein ACJ8E3_07295 [Sphingomicrobium sp.]
MRSVPSVILAAIVALSACGRSQQHDAQPQSNAPAPVAVNATDQVPEWAGNETAPVASEGSLSEPRGAIDPNSIEAAGQVVQHYGALVEQDRFLQAERLWGDVNAARSFATALDARFRDVHLEIGDLGETEGAAGSIYMTIPVVFYGTSEQGKPLRRPASIVLRRVNDVPGSTERQRRWHIERIEWKPAT